MPKIIPGLESQILAAARQVLLSEGYPALSMRALAKQCGIAVGTLYNYFPGKEDLAAAIMLADWQQVLAHMAELAETADTLAPGLTGLCRILSAFTGKYRQVWEQYGGRSPVFLSKYHPMLRQQLAQPIETLARRAGHPRLIPVAGVLAEAMLACAMNPDLGSERFGLLASTWEPQ